VSIFHFVTIAGDLFLNRIIPGLRASIVCRLGSGVGIAAATVLLATGCGTKDNWAKVNGVTITKAEYIQALERQTVAVPGGQPINAERFVIDQIIGNKIMLAEASKLNVMPSEKDVEGYFKLQKQLFEQQFPEKSYDTTLKEQGTTPEEIKSDMKVQLAEANVYAKRLNMGEDEVRKAYEQARNNVGLPARVQLRIILVAPNSPQYTEAKAMLDAKKPFADVATKVNPPQLKANGGLMAQVTPISQIAPTFQGKVQQSPAGAIIGPVDFGVGQGQSAKAWVKIEKKLPAFTIPFEDAAPLVRRQLVQLKISQPENAKVKDELMKLKLDAKFEPSEASYTNVWDGVKKVATDAGVGKISSGTPAITAAPGATAPLGGGPAGGGAGGAMTPPPGAAGAPR